MSFFDTHTHLNLDPLKSECEEIVSDCKNSQILLNVVGTNKITSIDAINIANRFSNVFSTIGFHPTSTSKIIFSDLDYFFESLINKDHKNKIIGIGETGLDYYHEKSNFEIQKKFFIKHIEIAKKFNKTLIVHARESHDDVLSILKKHMDNLNVIIHCFSGDKNHVKKYVELGCYISFSGIISFKNAIDIVEAARIVPINRLLIETDCPWLSPAPHRGKINVPQNIVNVFDALEQIRDEENLSEIIMDNSLKVFGLNKKTLI